MSGPRLCNCWRRGLRVNTRPVVRCLGRAYQSTTSSVAEEETKSETGIGIEIEESKLTSTSAVPAKPSLSVFSAQHSSKTTIEDVYLEQLGSKVKLNGWITDRRRRLSSNLSFCQFRDCMGDFIQLVAVDEDMSSALKDINPESIVCIEGFIQRNNQTEPFSRDIKLSSVHVINMASKPLPFSTFSPHLVKASLQYKYRYLVLRNGRQGKALRFRSRVSSLCRTVLESSNFTEIETPLLFKPTAEGAREFLVPTRDREQAYALTQSPQQYKQILMASGIFKYFQIVKCFRDEDLREDRQPEFTQLDLEMAFAGQEDVISITEHLIRTLLKTLLNIEISTAPFRRMTYQESLEKYGTDKPDLRCATPIQQITKFVNPSNIDLEKPIIEVVVLKKHLSNHTASQLRMQHTSGDTKVILISDSNLLSWLDESFANSDRLVDVQSCNASTGIEVGDTVLLCARSSQVSQDSTSLGRARQDAIRGLLAYEEKPPSAEGFNFLWVVDFPLFESSGSEKKPLLSKHHPFTSPHADDIDLLESEPLKVRGLHYDLVMNGVELGGGSVRIHDAAFQEYIFKNFLKLSTEEVNGFRHLLTALGSGCPPHAGIALGFDRLVATLLGTHSIRDVIAFPKSGAGRDLMVESPTGYLQ